MINNINQGSRFAEREEIIEGSEAVTMSQRLITAGGPVIDKQGKTLSILAGEEHTLTLAATGAKKTRTIIAPTVAMIAKASESMIINDPKGELYRWYESYLKTLGYNVVVLNFRDPMKGNRWNPCNIPETLYHQGLSDKSDQYLRDIAQCIYADLAATTNDTFWTSASEDYFTGLMQLIREECPPGVMTMENLRRVNATGRTSYRNEPLLKWYYASLNKDTSMAMNLEGTVLAPNETKSSIESVFVQPLSLYYQEDMRDMMAKSDFSMERIACEKTAVFIITPTERSIYNPIISTFIKQSYSVLCDSVASKMPDGRCPVRVNYVLDEFSNLTRIADFSMMISMARGQNIRFHLVVQNISQLESKYSVAEAETIMNNCDAWFVLRSKDLKLHKIVMEMCGNRYSEYSHTPHPLITGRTIQRFNKDSGEILILLSGKDPYITNLPDIDDYHIIDTSVTTNNLVERKPITRKVIEFRGIVMPIIEQAEKERKEEIKRKFMEIPYESESDS